VAYFAAQSTNSDQEELNDRDTSLKLRQPVELSCVAVFAGFALHSSRMATMKAKEAWKTGYWIWAGEPPATPDLSLKSCVSRRQPLAR
jgi:hypothetical protein